MYIVNKLLYYCIKPITLSLQLIGIIGSVLMIIGFYFSTTIEDQAIHLIT